MGDKTAARRLAQEVDVPVVPGTDHALESAEEAVAFAEKAGYPVILKARSGGGGRGMRVVRSGARCSSARHLWEAQAACCSVAGGLPAWILEPVQACLCGAAAAAAAAGPEE
jgi:biotin carboxylase